MLTAPPTRVPLSSTAPGAPIPIPAKSASAIPFSCIFARRLFATSGRTFSPLFSFLVGTSHLSRTVPSLSNRPILTVVPPTSTPNAYLLMLFFPFLRYMYSARRKYCRGRCFSDSVIKRRATDNSHFTPLLRPPAFCSWISGSGCKAPVPRYNPFSSGGG